MTDFTSNKVDPIELRAAMEHVWNHRGIASYSKTVSWNWTGGKGGYRLVVWGSRVSISVKDMVRVAYERRRNYIRKLYRGAMARV